MKSLLFIPLFLLSIEFSTASGFIMEGKELKFLFLGDSYTVGEGLKAEESYPFLLIRELEKKGFKVSIPKIIAKTGWTTDELLNAMMLDETLTEFDAVFLLAGVNNQFRGGSVNTYEKEFSILLNHAISFARHKPERVFVLSIPDYGYTPFGKENQPTISSQLDAFNKLNKALAIQGGTNYINVTDASRRAATETGLLAGDNLHPSSEQYSRWVKEFLPGLIKVIGKP